MKTENSECVKYCSQLKERPYSYLFIYNIDNHAQQLNSVIYILLTIMRCHLSNRRKQNATLMIVTRRLRYSAVTIEDFGYFAVNIPHSIHTPTERLIFDIQIQNKAFVKF